MNSLNIESIHDSKCPSLNMAVKFLELFSLSIKAAFSDVQDIYSPQLTQFNISPVRQENLIQTLCSKSQLGKLNYGRGIRHLGRQLCTSQAHLHPDRHSQFFLHFPHRPGMKEVTHHYSFCCNFVLVNSSQVSSPSESFPLLPSAQHQVCPSPWYHHEILHTHVALF